MARTAKVYLVVPGRRQSVTGQAVFIIGEVARLRMHSPIAVCAEARR